MEKSRKILLYLLGAPSVIDLRNVTPKQWHQVVNMAFEQGVAALMVDGLDRAYPEPVEGGGESPPLLESGELEVLRYKLIGGVWACEKNYKVHKETISRLAEFYKRNGIKMLLLKGHGLSLNYPVPTHRTCGDIDVYLYGKGDDADKLVSSRLSILVNYENPKHSVFSFEGVTVENHYTFTDVLESKANLMTEKVLEKYLDGAVESDLGCYLPSNEWNYIFLLRHLGKHFGIRSSINLRQVIDWGLFLKALPEDFDIGNILRDVKEVGLLKLNNLVTSLAEDIVGLDFSKFITERPSEKKREKVFDDIFSAPNAKFSENRLVGFVQRMFCFFSQKWKYKYLPESYAENLWYKIKTIRVFWK